MTVARWFTRAGTQLGGLLLCSYQSLAHPITTTTESVKLEESEFPVGVHVVHLIVCSLSGILIAMVGICFRRRSRANSPSPDEWAETGSAQKKGWKSIGWESWFARYKNRLSKSLSTSSASSARAPLVESPAPVWKSSSARYDTASTVSSGFSSSQKTTPVDCSLSSEASGFQCKASQVSTTSDVYSSGYSSKPSSSVGSNKSFQSTKFDCWNGTIVRRIRDLRTYFSTPLQNGDTADIYERPTDLEPHPAAQVIANEGVTCPVTRYSAGDAASDELSCPEHQYRLSGLAYPGCSTNPTFVMDQGVIANIGTDYCDCRRPCDLSHSSSLKDIIDPIYSRIVCCSHDQLANESIPSVLTQWSPWQQSAAHSSCASNLERYPSTHIYELPTRCRPTQPPSGLLLPWQPPDRLADDADTCSPPQLPARHYGKSTVDLVDQLRRQVHFEKAGDMAAFVQPNLSQLHDNSHRTTNCLPQKTHSVTSISGAVQGQQLPAASDVHQWCSELDVANLPKFNNPPGLQVPLFYWNLDGFATSGSVSLSESLDKSCFEIKANRERPHQFHSALHRKHNPEDDRPSIWSTAVNSVMHNITESLSNMRHIDSELDIPQQLMESMTPRTSYRPIVPLRLDAPPARYLWSAGSSSPSAGSFASTDTVSRLVDTKRSEEMRPRTLMSPLMERSIEDEEARRMLVNVW